MIKFKKKNGRKNKTSTDKRRQKQALGNEGKNKEKRKIPLVNVMIFELVLALPLNFARRIQ